MAEPLQRQRGDGVARGRGVVVARFGALYEFFVIVAGEPKPARGAVFELLQKHLGEVFSELERIGTELGLHHIEQRGQQKSVVIEIGVEMGAAVLAGSEQALVTPHRRTNKRQGPARRSQPVGAAEHARGARHAGDHQRVPADEDLVVAARPHPPRPRGAQFLATGVQ